jgi:inositol oxygenase
MTDFRNYNNVNEKIRENYKLARINQNYKYVMKMKNDFKLREKVKMNIWDVIDKLSDFIDISDPDINIPNAYHLFQTAEKARSDLMPDWFQLTCLLHDIGKIMYMWGNDDDGTSINNQWGIVGDTFIVGCKIPSSIVFSEYNELNEDNNKYDKFGMYYYGCGLNNCIVSWGHDEFMYLVLRNNRNILPTEAYYIVRFHSLYLWHKENEYKYFEDNNDKKYKFWVQEFNKYDLYTKKNDTLEIIDLKKYYSELMKKYFGNLDLLW